MTRKKKTPIKNGMISVRGVIPFICVAFAVFAATAALYFLIDRLVTDSYAPSSLTGWEYTYSDTPDVKNTDPMKLFNSQNPIVHGERKHDYIYFVKNVEASDEDRTLKIVTDHSPMMVFVNGFEVYNNRYSGDNAAEYVGNCYNSVTLEGNGRGAVVEVFLRLPFSVRFEPTIEDGAKDKTFEITFGLVAAAVVAAAGLIGAAVSFVAGALRKRIGRVPALFLLVFFCGGAAALCMTTDLTYYINDPAWLNYYTAAAFSAVFFCIVFLAKYGRKQKTHVIVTLAAGTLSCLALIFSRTPALYRTALIASCAAAVVCLSLVASSIFKAVSDREQYSATAYIANVYYIFCILFSGASLFFRSSGAFIFTFASSSVALLTTLIMLERLSCAFDEGKELLKAESERYGECVNKLAAL